MKMKINNNNNVSTKKDIQSVKKEVVTLRQDLKKTEGLLRREITSLELGLNFKIDSLEARMKKADEKFDKFKDFVTTNLDWLVGAFKKFDEEHTYSLINSQKISSYSKIMKSELRA